MVGAFDILISDNDKKAGERNAKSHAVNLSLQFERSGFIGRNKQLDPS